MYEVALFVFAETLFKVNCFKLNIKLALLSSSTLLVSFDTIAFTFTTFTCLKYSTTSKLTVSFKVK